MYALLVLGQLAVMVALVVISFWGWGSIDPETRISARDVTRDSTMRSKTTALVWAPAIGLVVLLGTIAVADSTNRDTIAGLGLALLIFFLLAHWSTVKRAAR